MLMGVRLLLPRRLASAGRDLSSMDLRGVTLALGGLVWLACPIVDVLRETVRGLASRSSGAPCPSPSRRFSGFSPSPSSLGV